MSTHGEFAPDVAAGTRVESLLRRSLAAASIFVLAGIGIYIAWSERPAVENVLLALAYTLGPATAYAFGYFRCLPDALGGRCPVGKGTPWQRWSDFARLSAIVAILIVGSLGGLVVARQPHSQIADAAQLVVVQLVLASVMLAGVVASEQYLARTMVRGDALGGMGWRAGARRLAGRWGTGLVRRLGAKRSLTSGCVLVLASLILITTQMNSCGGDYHPGYEIVSGKAVWITAALTVHGDTAKVIVAQADRWMYVLGLVVAVVGLGAVLAGRAGDALRRSRPLAVLSGVLSLFGICDYTFAWVREFAIVPGLTNIVWAVVWGLPIALWLWRARGDPRRWEYTRLAVLVLYLPIMFCFLNLLAYLAAETPGYVSFQLGMLFVWWGFVQSQWEIVGPP